MCSSEINGEGELKVQLANPGSPGKMAVKTVYVVFDHVEKEGIITLLLLLMILVISRCSINLFSADYSRFG